MLKIFLVFTVLTLSVIVFLILLLLYWAPGTNRKKLPKPELTDLPEGHGDANHQSTLTIMTWNIGFGGGAKGDPTNIYTKTEVLANLSLIEHTVKKQDPDILLLQEVDKPSNRTGMIDEYNELMDRLDFRYGCFVTTWDCHYVPFPLTFDMEKHLGKIQSGQAILSKMPILGCEGIRLPQPEHNSWVEDHFSWWKRLPFIYRALKRTYNRFYIHRTIQKATIDLGTGNHIPIFNCHLEAFDQKNREEQAGILYNTLNAVTGPMIVGGDFNALPSDATKKRGFADENIDFTTDKTLNIIMKIKGLRDTIAGSEADIDEAATFTFPSDRPTRRLDYLLQRGFMLVTEGATVIHDAKGSDHLPIIVNLVMR